MTRTEEVRDLSFKPRAKEKLMNHVYSEYTDAEIEKIYALLSGDSFNYDIELKVGETVIGKVAGESPTNYLFDVGYKDFIHIEKRKGETEALFRYADEDGSISQNTEIEILITDISESPYMIKGSLSSLHKKFSYNELLENMDETIIATIVAMIPAGFTLELNHNGYKIPAFMPKSSAGLNKLSAEELEEISKKSTIEVMIDSYSVERGSFIASRKKYLESLGFDQVNDLKIKDENGNYVEYTGVVTGTGKTSIYVQFLDIFTGMIHESNLNDEFRSKLSTIKEGSEIKFFIRDIIKNKLNLMQEFKESVWDTVKVDNEYTGVVKQVKDFGILVSLDSQTVGLIKQSEVDKMSVKPKYGDTLKVKVSQVIKYDRKLFLKVV
ncbi:MAG: hypothetical protein RL308_3419 [Bacteroidota bacterium]|jgi:ribosomal protein S1